jgi:hypothetical protein
MAISAAGRCRSRQHLERVRQVLQGTGLELQAETQDSAMAKITMLRRFQFTSDSIEIPAATTMPNITITPPPSTSIGTVESRARPSGTRPQTIRKSAPMVTTWRLMTPVIAIRPTFWLNDVLGRPPKTPESAVPKPSAKVAPWISLSVASRPAPPLVIP